MAEGYLLDTNTVIDFASLNLPSIAHNKLSKIIDVSPCISVINKIELLSFKDLPLEILLFIETANVIWLNDEVVNCTINFRKIYKIKLPDAVIAATAFVFGLTLVTHSMTDFRRIDSLQLIDSYLLT